MKSLVRNILWKLSKIISSFVDCDIIIVIDSLVKKSTFFRIFFGTDSAGFFTLLPRVGIPSLPNWNAGKSLV